MNTLRAAPPMTFSNTVNKIAPSPSSIPSSSTREPIVTTPNLQRQQQSSTNLGHQDTIHSNDTTRVKTTNDLVENEQKQPTSATHSEMERPASTSTDLPSDINQVASISCMNCGTTTTPLWRRAPNGDTICNACGLYLKARHTYRPTTMKRNIQPKKRQQQQTADSAVGATTTTTIVGGCEGHGTSESISGSCPGGGKCNGTGGSSSCAGCPTFNNQQLRRQQEQQLEGLVCANCATTTTPLWRRDDQGNTICNACGLYYKLHNVHRPVSMKRSVIKRRRRLIVMGSGGDDHGDDDEELMQGDNDEHQQHIIDHDQPQQPQSPAPSKKIRKPYRKRIKATDEGSDQQAKWKRSRQSTSSDQPHSSPSIAATAAKTKSALSVPAIEDYIVPKRTGLPATAELLSSSSSSSHTTVTPPPLNGLHQQPSPYHQQQFYQHHHPPSHLSSTRVGNSPSSLSLPPISSERRSAHFDPFYRDGRAPSPASTPSSSSSSTPANASLPSISLPPLLRPTATTPSTTINNNNNNNNNNDKDMSTLLHHPNTTSSTHSTPLPPSPNSTGSSSAFTSTRPPPEMDQPSEHLQQQQQPYPAFMELEDWDEALKNLQLLRKKVQPEHVRTLAQLSKPLWDMVSKAQSIVHGTGALSHP